MKKLYTIIVATTVVLVILLIYLFAAHKPATAPSSQITNQTSPTPPQFKGQEEMLKNALNLYAKKKQKDVDFANGPCLGKIADDWVLDIAHNPRQAVDDKQENQCAEYRTGSAHHFIELDPTGNLIRAL